MKAKLMLTGKFFITTTFFLFLALLNINAQTALPLADSLNKWSEPVERFIAQEGTPRIRVRSKVIKHFGTTGVIEVEITNISDRTLAAAFGLKVTRGDANDNLIHPNNMYQLNLKAGYRVTYKMELRECSPKGGRKMDDIEKCKACQPRLLFIWN
jgi:hypothetical protein